MAAAKQQEDGKPLPIDAWIGTFVADHAKGDGNAERTETGSGRVSDNADNRADKAQERAKDIQAFDALIRKNPEILAKLRAQGIDLDAEKIRERERISAANPGMPDDEIVARSSIAVYLLHQDAIRDAAPSGAARKELDSGFALLRSHARESGIPYPETVRNAPGILPTDKASIMAATT